MVGDGCQKKFWPGRGVKQHWSTCLVRQGGQKFPQRRRLCKFCCHHRQRLLLFGLLCLVDTMSATLKASIAPVPTANDFLDIVLSKTQRKTPTVIHPGFKITRIRSFYMRKVMFTKDAFVEKLQGILNEFPVLEVCAACPQLADRVEFAPFHVVPDEVSCTPPWIWY